SDAAPQVDRLRMYYNHPGFVQANIENLTAALNQVPENRRAARPIVFTAHSIPLSMAEHCDYELQLRETCRLAAESVPTANWQLVYQSRSGSPRQPWLEPDILTHLRSLRESGVEDAVVMPIDFISDHMEVLYDLDIEAKKL